MKNWRLFFKESLKKEHIKAQFKPGSHLWRMFIFSAVAAISFGVIYNFIYQYIGGTRAATENVVVTAGASKPQVALNEEFTVNVLFSGANAKKISQLDFKLNVAPEGSAAVSYIPTKITGTAVDSSTNYFDEIVLEQPAANTSNVRVVLTTKKQDAQLTDRVIVKVTFKGTANGRVNFTVDQPSLEVVGPGGDNVPTTFTVGTGSNVNTRVDIGDGPSATPISTAPTIITPSPTGIQPSVTGTQPTVTGVQPTVTGTQPTITGPTAGITISPNPGTITPTSTPVVSISITPAGPTKIPSGESCNTSDQCMSGFACTNGKCMPVFCDGQHACPGGYSCRQGVCFPTACNATNTCSNGYTCQTPENICMPQPNCGADRPCAPGYTCTEGGSCQKTQELGQCTENNQCGASGQCVNNNCFCADGKYNCDRNWANGCEASAPCQGSGTAKINVKVKFNGIGANIDPADKDMKITVVLANKYLLAPLERTLTVQATGKDERNIDIYEGSFDVNGIPFGTDYTVFLKGEQHLQKRICENTPKETIDGRYVCTKGSIVIKEGLNTLDFSDIYMLAGDLPISNQQSGFIDAVDMVFIRANLGTKDPDLLPIGDLNKDDIIDSQDYALAVYALSFKYDDVSIEE